MKSLKPVIFILSLAFICLGILAAANYILSIPRQAAQIYGPPNPNIGEFKTYQYAVQLLLLKENLIQPASLGSGLLSFEINSGETADTVINRLYDAGLVKDPNAMRIFMQYSGIETRLQTGTFSLSIAMTPVEIAATIQNPDAAELSFYIFPGWRIEEIASSFPTSGLRITPEEFLAAARQNPMHYLPSLDLPDLATHEGFLLPDRYIFHRDVSVEQVLTTMLHNFDMQVTPEMRAAFSTQGLSMYNAVILASIVEREAVLDEEQPKIASVFLNRIRIGMGLQADPTVQYAIGTHQNWWKSPLTYADLQFNSPYNTYVVNGLPPGPIANPSILALKSIAYPETTDYFYFRAACDGSGKHLFSVDFEGHKENACP